MTLKWCEVVESGELELHFARKGDNAPMLIGTYQHNIDAKGRVFIPVKLRGDLGERFIVSKGLDNCLFVHSLKEWEKIEQTITALPIAQRRDVQRFWFSGACEVELDAQGRIGIPQNLREYASLAGATTIIGASTRVEIWNAERWNEESESKSADEIAAIMEQLGM